MHVFCIKSHLNRTFQRFVFLLNSFVFVEVEFILSGKDAPPPGLDLEKRNTIDNLVSNRIFFFKQKT